jgi:hypothetical protein
VRKHLGVLAGIAALCVTSWAQTPAQDPAQTPAQAPAQAPAQTPASEPVPIPTPIPASTESTAPLLQYPRYELFGGGTYAEAGFFNAGHWAGLPGWDASLGLNATSWLGILVDGGQLFGTSKIPVGTPAPFQNNPCQSACTGPTFDVATREYNFLFGAQFSRRKYERWTPFGEIMYGHQGIRGQITLQTEVIDSQVSSGRALVAGGGIDRKINERFALRFKADYLQTASSFALIGKAKQDNFRFSVGVVIRSVHKKKRTLEDEIQP